jgi:hypothetical protein
LYSYPSSKWLICIRQYIPLQFLFPSIISYYYWVPGQFPYDIYISMYVCRFHGTGNSMVILGKFFSFFLNFMRWMFSYLYLNFCKSSRREIINRKASCTYYFFRDHFSCFVKIQGEILILTVNPQCVMFLKFRRNCGNAGIIYQLLVAHLYRWSINSSKIFIVVGICYRLKMMRKLGELVFQDFLACVNSWQL